MVFLRSFVIFLAACIGSWPCFARDHIRIVGSSTVFPFVAAAAEQFGKIGEFRTPIVEATGTGGGIHMFCSGIGVNTPDIANASRPMKPAEKTLCRRNGVKDIAELSIGYDGIVLANAVQAPSFRLTKKHIFLALAKQVPRRGVLVENFYTHWHNIDKNLPHLPIKMYGPPPTSGTRDAFVELVMEEGCKAFPEFVTTYPHEATRKFQCSRIREDGAFIEAGENDNLIVQKLVASPEMLGIFGYNFLEQNAALVKANSIDGVLPSLSNITSGNYHIARSLYVYVKLGHIHHVSGLHDFIKLLTSEAAIGTSGFLIIKGLLPLTGTDRQKSESTAKKLTPME